MKKQRKTAASTVIQNCHLVGVHWDAKAVESVQTVAEALLNLTRLFGAQGLNVPMIQVNGPDTKGQS